MRTDSLLEANRKAAEVEREILAEWEALAAGRTADAHRHYEAARKLAAARGFHYMPTAALASSDIDEIVSRLLALAKSGGEIAAPEVRAALLGNVAEVAPTFEQVFDDWREMTRTDRAGKSAAQAQRWERSRRQAIESFNAVIAKDLRFPSSPLPVNKIERAHALAYREWWSKRIEADGLTASAANRNIGYLSRILSEWSKLKDREIDNPFAGLRLKGRGDNRTPPFSTEWIEDKLLAPDAFDALNDEARDVLLMMVNTGLRPSEITDAPPADFMVDAPIPFFRVAPHGRELKVEHTERDIPLTGVSLDAAKRIAERGGIKRYAHKSNGWSAAVSKHLRAHNLRETDRHTPYSLRHALEDRLLEAGIDDRVRADILGHRYARPRYGEGGALKGRLAALRKVALPDAGDDDAIGD
nr:tyrosine-type recombinase/integrase [Tropicimonas sp. IMCC34043]